MDAETKTVIKNIAQIQVEALIHISKNLEDTDHYLLKKLLQIEEGEIRGHSPTNDEADTNNGHTSAVICDLV